MSAFVEFHSSFVSLSCIYCNGVRIANWYFLRDIGFYSDMVFILVFLVLHQLQNDDLARVSISFVGFKIRFCQINQNYITYKNGCAQQTADFHKSLFLEWSTNSCDLQKSYCCFTRRFRWLLIFQTLNGFPCDNRI